MKRALFWTLALGLFLAVPAIPQDQGGLDAVKEIRALRETLQAQEARIAALEGYVAVHKTEAAELARRLRDADRQGFLYPAPNTDARRALLQGLTRFADTAATGKAGPPRDDGE